MRSSWMIFTAALALVAMPLAAGADDADVQEQLRQMQERMMLLEDKLQNTNDQLDAATTEVNQQKQVMSNAGLDVEGPGASGVDSFLQSLEIGGWVEVSYWHNFNDPGNGESCGTFPGNAQNNANTGNSATSSGFSCGSGGAGVFNPLNPDSQGFSFDQLWFELERPVSPEQRSGFRADITFGKIADLLSGDSSSTDSDDDVYIHQANIQYLWDAPIIGDTKLTLGKFGTLLGYEVAQGPYNYNVSRSLLWAAFQPVDHLGFLMSGTIDKQYHLFGVEGSLDWDFGVVNGFGAADPDVNHGKTWTGRIRMTGENWSIATAAITGAEAAGSESDKLTVFDLIMTWDPFTDLNLWLNFNRAWANPDGADPDAWGISIGGHYTINERAGATLRVDFAQVEDPGYGQRNQDFFDDDSGFGFVNLNPNVDNFDDDDAAGFDEEALSVTGTLHYQLSDQIQVRGEVRYDNYERFCRRAGNTPASGRGNFCSDQIFNEGSPADDDGNSLGGDSDQFVAGVDVIYEF